jgi:hypothetical protein
MSDSFAEKTEGDAEKKLRVPPILNPEFYLTATLYVLPFRLTR